MLLSLMRTVEGAAQLTPLPFEVIWLLLALTTEPPETLMPLLELLSTTERLMFPFSFGPFVGFWAAFEGAVALGNLCLPAGGLSTGSRLNLGRAKRWSPFLKTSASPTRNLLLRSIASRGRC